MREGWREVRLADVAETLLGKTLKRDGANVEFGLPYLRNVNVQWGKVSTVGLNTMLFTPAEREAYALKKNDILVCEGGEVGRLALLREDLPGVFFQNALHRVRVHEGVNARYIAIALEHLVRSGGLVGLVRQVTIAHLNQTLLRRLHVPLPPLAEQRRIVDLIGSVDDAIEAADAEAVTATQVWSSACEAIKSGPDSRSHRVEELVEHAKSGGTPPRDNPANYGGSIPWLKSGDVRGRAISEGSEMITVEGLSASSAWLVPAGAVLVAMYGGGTVGNVGRLSTPMATNQAVLALTADETCIAAALMYHLLASDSERLAAQALGAAQANISKKIVLAHRINVPPRDRQAEFLAALDAALNTVDAARATGEALRTLRSNLLTVLLSGEHEIPESYDQLMNLDVKVAA